MAQQDQILGTPFTPDQQIATQNSNNAQNPNYQPTIGAKDMTGTTPQQPGPNVAIPSQTPEQKQAVISATGQQPAQDSAQSIAQKFTQGFQTAKESGTPAPASLGDAMKGVNDITGGPTLPPPTPPAPPPTSPAVQQFQTSPEHQQTLADQQAYMSTANQQQTGQQLYDQIASKVSADFGQSGGLAGIDAKLMNWSNIINGTESDIANEISKAGGFATGSQVQSMTLARNKLMVLNYQNLLKTKDDITNQIDKMVGFSQQDKALALDTALKQIGFDQKNEEYAQIMQKNAADAYNKIIDAPGYGYKALYASTGGDPHAIGMVESALKLPPGALAQLSAINQAHPDLKTQLTKLDNGNTVLINTQTGDVMANLGGAGNKNVWSDAYSLGGNLVQKNSETGEIRTAVAGKTTPTGGVGGKGISQALADAINGGMIDPNKINSRTLGIYESIAQAQVDAVGAHAGASGETKAVTDLSTYKSTATRTLGVIEKNLPLVMGLADKVNTLGIPGLDSYAQGIKSYTGNNPDVIKYVNSLKTLRSEYAQMLSKGAVATEGDKADATQAIPSGLSSAGYKALGDQLKLEATNIISASNDAIAAAKNKSASNTGSQNTQSVIPQTSIPSGYYQASDGLLYPVKK